MKFEQNDLVVLVHGPAGSGNIRFAELVLDATHGTEFEGRVKLVHSQFLTPTFAEYTAFFGTEE